MNYIIHNSFVTKQHWGGGGGEGGRGGVMKNIPEKDFLL